MYNFRQANSTIDFNEISHVSKIMSDKIWGIISFTAELIIDSENMRTLSHTNASQCLKWKQKASILNTITREFKPITFNQLNSLKEGQVGTRSAEGDVSLGRGDKVINLQGGRERKTKMAVLASGTDEGKTGSGTYWRLLSTSK